MTAATGRIGRLLLWRGVTGRPSEADWTVLSGEERDRARRFLNPAECDRYVCAHAAVRRALADVLGCAPAAVRLGREPCPGCGDLQHGPPSVLAPATALRFSHSRSRFAWLLAIEPEGRRVGADIEQVRSIGAFDSMVGSCLTPAERSYVTGGADEPERRSRFYRCWVRKEAVLKAVGTGLAGGLARLEVWPAETGGAVVTPDAPGPARYRVRDVPLGPELAAAVAEELPSG